MRKKRIINTLLAFIVTFGMMLTTMIDVSAASFSVSKSTNTVAPGGSFTVTISASDVNGRFNISASNGSVSQSSFWVTDQGSTTITVVAGGAGTTTVSVVAADLSGSSNPDEVLSGQTRSVSVSVVAPSGGNSGGNSGGGSTSNRQPTTPQEPETPKSSNNNLAELTVSQGTLSPEFNVDTSDYSVNLDASITSFVIDAKASDEKATISGTGEKALDPGENNFEIIVTAEDGSTKTYTVKAIVDEKPLVYVKYNGQKLGVVRNTKDLPIPAGFEETTVKINGQDVKAWVNNAMKKTIVYLSNDKNERNFYIYDKEVTSIFKPVALLGQNVFIVDIPKDKQDKSGFKYQEITIDGNKMMGWKFEDKAFKNYSLIYVMNEKGEMVYYQYESTQNTLQLYSNGAPITNETYESLQKYKTYGIFVVGIGTIAVIAAIVLGVFAWKYKAANAKIVSIIEKRSEV